MRNLFILYLLLLPALSGCGNTRLGAQFIYESGDAASNASSLQMSPLSENTKEEVK